MDDAKEIRRRIERDYPGLPFHEAVATFILGQWARVSAHDPATYVKSMARVLEQFGERTALAASDPARGVSIAHNKPPTMKELHDWLQKEGARQQVAEKGRGAPQFRRVERTPTPPSIGPNLFVPADVPGYDRVLRMHEETKGNWSRPDRRVCSDGEWRDGLWVPLMWWEDGRAATAKAMPPLPVNKVVEDNFT